MNDTQNLAAESPSNPADQESDLPQFGLIDIVESFTALRHEYRNQVKETRVLTSQLQQSSEQILALESKFAEMTVNPPARQNDSQEAEKRFAKTLVDFDIQLSRAVDAVVAHQQSVQSRRKKRRDRASKAISKQSWTARLFAKSAIKAFEELANDEPETDTSVADGLSILLTKFRQTLDDHGVTRIETEGQPFNGEIMHSIGQYDLEGVASGHVSQQLSAAYVCKNAVLKYAQVRVAP